MNPMLPRLADIIDGAQWVGWRFEQRDGKPTKVPINPHTGERARSDNPRTWGTAEQAVDRYDRDHLDGVGIMFANGVSGLDVDSCVDPATGQIKEWAQPLLAMFTGTYREWSVSHRGVHALALGTVPAGTRRKYRDGAVEMYDRGRFFTVSDEPLPDAPIVLTDHTAAFQKVYDLVVPQRDPPRPAPAPQPSPPPGQRDLSDDDAVVAAASEAADGAEFVALWHGAWKGRYLSQSEADFALVRRLLAYTEGDGEQTDRLFQRSGLMRPKWNRQDYRERTITAAVSRPIPPPVPTDYRAAETALIRARDAQPPAEPVALTAAWPDPIGRAAYYGIIGEFVDLVAPHTEADPSALLLQTGVALGNCVGRNAYFPVEADKHYLNLYACLVGVSARARKGTAFGHVRRLLQRVDGKWVETRILDGLSSGEGLITQARDPVYDKDGDIVDPGVSDRRMLVMAPEFANVLAVQSREGSTLSGLLRTAWDGHSLRTLTRRPLVATNPHISLLGHVTRDELLALFDNTSAANGFGNRLLWGATRRARLLPDGGAVPDKEFAALAAKVEEAVAFARKAERITRDEEAAALWRDAYPVLSADEPGLLGAMTARGEAQVVRLAALYAVLDKSHVVRVEHLYAAMAIWAFCAASVRWIFGDKLGDPIADEILRALRASGAEGLTRSEISGLFSNNRQSARIGTALAALEGHNLAFMVLEAHESGSGRPTEHWYARKRD